MPVRPVSRLLAAALVAGLGAVALPQAASAATPVAPSVLRADVQIHRFAVNKTGLTALGTETAQLAGEAARQKVTFTVAKGGSCNVLTLNLQQLNLQLLGLNLVSSAINLKITGRSSESLGALFCKLSKGLKIASVASARAVAASLNHHLHGHPLHAIRLRAVLPVVSVQAAQAPPATPGCKVLDLVLGPLNLDLLGLVVNLYGPDATKPVEVHVTADPAGGILGSVFCRLASGQAVA